MKDDIKDLEYIVSEIRKESKKIVFTNGVFDILHKGHVDYLKESANFGNVLIVGVNSDSSVKRLKGEDRPVNPENDRAFILSELRSVDYVVIFDEDTPVELINFILPDVLVKGSDYDPDVTDKNDPRFIVGSDIVKKNGGEVKVVKLTPGRSTTQTIKKMRKQL
ncbi:MAG: D-glycero-beta-D-manno-heptose 1-phosphate adenylyltransferase [Candidatus Delongbacteria bacterium]|nr:D-glycero-beta-D-manno-heptose 1-phosphate adenylyltransferase [Candidatus Delongbacteria bacterium]